MTTTTPLAAPAASAVIQGKNVAVSPAKLPQLMRVLQLCDEGRLLDAGVAIYESATRPQGVDPEMLLRFMARHGDALVESFAVLLRMERAQLDALDLDDVLLLCTEAVQVNLDFFTQRLMKKLLQLVEAKTTASTPPSAAPGAVLEGEASATAPTG